MSDASSFQPLTSQLGIAGSSYQLQMGRVNDFWAVRLIKGTNVLASNVFKDNPDPKEPPLGNHITGWILSVLAIPNLNTYQIQKTVGFIRQKAIRTWEEQQLLKKSAGKSEMTEVKLEHIAENVQIKRPQTQGWVKEEKAQEIQEIDPELAKASPGLVGSNTSISGTVSEAVYAIKSKNLPEIPKGEGFTMQSFVYRRKSGGNVTTPVSVTSNPDLRDIIVRISRLEQRMANIERENAELRASLNRIQ